MRRGLPEKIGDILTSEQYAEVKELGLLVDKDDQVPHMSCSLRQAQFVGLRACQLCSREGPTEASAIHLPAIKSSTC